MEFPRLPAWARTLLAAVPAVLLLGCVHPQQLTPHVTTLQEAIQKIGTPSARVATGSGTRLVYYWRGSRQCWWLHFDRSGRFLSAEEVFNEPHFNLVKIGQSTRDDVVKLFGTPPTTVEFPLKGTTAYKYEYYDPSFSESMLFWVEFRPDGVVLDTACTIDEPVPLSS